MIEYTKGNMFECNADCLINTVNCEGFMGKGVAYQFKMRFPENNKSYVKACKSGELAVGKVHSFMEAFVELLPKISCQKNCDPAAGMWKWRVGFAGYTFKFKKV